MNDPLPRKAIIYVRVSDPNQARVRSVSRREVRCREYASVRGYEIVDTFRDEGSANQKVRPGLEAMLAYLKALRGDGRYVIVVDDFAQLSRRLEGLMELREAISQSGGDLEVAGTEVGEVAIEARGQSPALLAEAHRVASEQATAKGGVQ